MPGPTSIKRQYRRGQTCFEVLWVVIAIAVGILLSVKSGRHFGTWSYLGGFATGFAGVILGLLSFQGFAKWWIPWMPVCVCGADSYKIDDFTNKRMVMRCQVCSRKYIKNPRSVEELLSDGTLIHYASHKPSMRWKVDRLPE